MEEAKAELQREATAHMVTLTEAKEREKALQDALAIEQARVSSELQIAVKKKKHACTELDQASTTMAAVGKKLAAAEAARLHVQVSRIAEAERNQQELEAREANDRREVQARKDR
ncbi:unnamed protein product [Closterium sp. NIES-64]|nr:unnamed protein product [Closterium sp. NIES-64]